MKIITFLSTSLLVLFVACGNQSDSKKSDNKGEQKEVASNNKIYEFKFSHVTALDTPKGKAGEFLKKRMDEVTNGAIKVIVYPNSSYSHDNALLNEIERGNIQMGSLNPAIFTSKIKEFAFFDIPYLFRDYDHLHAVYSSEVGYKLAKKLIDLNPDVYMPISYWDSGFKSLCSRKAPLINPVDPNGQKSRVMQSKILEEQMRSVGSLPVPMPFGEVYNALNQGTIDMTENTLSNQFNSKFYEACGYLTVTNHGFISALTFIDKRFYDSLPDDLKTKFMQVMKETTEIERKASIDDESLMLQKLKDISKTRKNVVITELTDEQKEAWVKSMKTAYPNFYEIVPKEWILQAQDIKPPYPKEEILLDYDRLSKMP